MNSVINLLKSHRSIRKFQKRPIQKDLLLSLIEAGQAAASSSFIQACTVIHVIDQEKRNKIASFAGEQSYVAESSNFLVFCADLNRNKQACKINGIEIQADWAENFITSTVDCALFAQNVLTAAESEGIGGVYIGGIRNKIEEVADLLNLPDLVYPVFGLCLGYPNQNPEVKPRLPLEIIFMEDNYNNDLDVKDIKNYDSTMNEYYQHRSENNKALGWSDQIAVMMGKEARPHILPFLNKKGFLKR